MPKLDLTAAKRIKVASGEVNRLKGVGFEWIKPAPDLRAQVIAALYGNDEQGAMYDPSDLSTLFQDSAGTTPVTADGQPVERMLDVSGNGNHATQTSATRIPLYRTNGALHWLEFDGVDDFMLFSLPWGGALHANVYAGYLVSEDNSVGRMFVRGFTAGYVWGNAHDGADTSRAAYAAAGSARVSGLVANEPYFWRLRYSQPDSEIYHERRPGGEELRTVSSSAALVSDDFGLGAGHTGNQPARIRLYSFIAAGAEHDAATASLVKSFVDSKRGAA